MSDTQVVAEAMRRLETVRPNIEEWLRQLAVVPPPAAARSLHFEVFPGEVRYRVPVVSFLLDDDDNEVFGWASPEQRLLPDLLPLVDPQGPDSKEHSGSVEEQVAERLLQWLAACLRAVLEPAVDLAVTASLHDEEPMAISEILAESRQ